MTGLYSEILNRVPNQSEAAAWVGNYNAFRGDRQRLVREFLKAAQMELDRRQPLPLPAAIPQEGQLSVTASLLRDALEDEVGGTPQGRQVLLMSRNLVNASRSFDSLPVSAVPAREQAYRDVGAAVAALQAAMATEIYSAPSSSPTWIASCRSTARNLVSRPTPVFCRRHIRIAPPYPRMP